MCDVGEMGLPYSEAGSVVQSLARVIVDRGYEFDTVKDKLRSWAYSGYEDDWWDRWGGPALDSLESALGLEVEVPDVIDTDGYCWACASYGNVHDPAKHGVHHNLTCGICGKPIDWFNDVPLRGFCWGQDGESHAEWSALVP